MEITIESAKAAHFASIAAIYNVYIESGTSTMDEELKTAENIAAWVDKFNDREELHVLVQGEMVLGWGIIKRYSDRNGYRFACETSVYLHQDFLGKGLGSTLKKHLIERCKALNYHHLVAKIFATNTASINYNIKLGYEIIGHQKEIGFKNGQWVDVTILGLRI